MAMPQRPADGSLTLASGYAAGLIPENQMKPLIQKAFWLDARSGIAVRRGAGEF
jgi:hypothetical protein